MAKIYYDPPRRPPMGSADHGGRLSAGLPDVADFSASTGPAGIPRAARAALRDVSWASEYPDISASRLVGALAAHAGVPARCVVPGNGASELIHAYFRHAVPGRRVLIPAPTFSEYERAARLAGCRPSFFGTMHLGDDLDAFSARLPRGGCAVVCNPNNPTGALLRRRQVSRLISAAASRSCALLVDECFVELADPAESVARSAPRRRNLAVLRSLTKSFCLAGVRLGYLVAPAPLAGILRGAAVPWNTSGAAQAAGVAALGEKGYLEAARAMVRREAAYLRRGISGIAGLECLPSEANFMLVRARDPRRLRRALLERGVLVRSCAGFRGLEGCVRISVRTRRENRLLLRALGEAA